MTANALLEMGMNSILARDN